MSAYLIDLNGLIPAMQEEGYTNWKIRDPRSASASELASFEGSDFHESFDKLKEALKWLAGSVEIVLSCKTAAEKTKGGDLKSKPDRRYTYRIKSDAGKSGINGVEYQSAPSGMEQIISGIREQNRIEIEKLRAEFEHKREIDALKAKIAELESGDQYKEMAMTGINLLAQHLGGGNPIADNPINGPEEGEAPSNSERIKAALMTWAKADKNYIERLEIVADLAANKPGIYNLAIDKLKSL